MDKIFELRQQIALKKTAMRKLVTTAETENRDMSEAEDIEFQGHKSAIVGLNKRVTKLEEVGDEDADVDDEVDDNVVDDDVKPAKRSTSMVRETARVSSPAQIVRSAVAAAVHTRKHQYSVMRAIRGLMNKNKPRLEGLEAEWSQEIARQSERSPQGFYMPHHFGNPKLAEQRALSLTTGAGAIPIVTEASMIEFLYNRTCVILAGATVVDDMVNKFALPRQNATSTAYWVGEGSSPTGSNPTSDQVVFTPNTIADFVDLTRKFIMQSAVSAEKFVRSDISRMIALGIDYAALNGSGSSNQPLGIFQDSGTSSVSLGTNSGVPTWNAVVDLETKVAVANADVGKLAYMTSANGRGTLKTTPKIGSTYPVFLCENNEVNGHKLFVSNQIPTNFTQGTGTNLAAMTFGNWADLIIALFGATDILVDPYTGSSSGTVRINIFQDADIHLRHEASFANLLFINNQ